MAAGGGSGAFGIPLPQFAYPLAVADATDLSQGHWSLHISGPLSRPRFVGGEGKGGLIKSPLWLELFCCATCTTDELCSQSLIVPLSPHVSWGERDRVRGAKLLTM
jgi:hypothetical protein